MGLSEDLRQQEEAMIMEIMRKIKIEKSKSLMMIFKNLKRPTK